MMVPSLNWATLRRCSWNSVWIGALALVAALGYRVTIGATSQAEMPSLDDLRAIARKGVPIVTAAYKFKAERGLWPSSLADLSPDYLAADKVEGWAIAWKPQGWWQVVNRAGLPDYAVRYQVGGNDNGWAVTDGIYAELLGVEQPKPPPSKLTPLRKRELRRSELQRRIAREPMRYVHRQALVGHYFQQKQYEEARQECLACQRICPDHWWPRVMRSRIDLKRGKKAQALAELRAWTSQYKDFTHRLFVAEFLMECGDKQAARVALRDAAKFPLAELFGSNSVGEVLGWGETMFAWNGALMAYDQGWHDEARVVCDRWEEYYRKELNTGDPGFSAIRAACHLAEKDYVKAGVEAILARKLLGERNRGWNWNFNLLEDAIKKKDATFRYKPEGEPEPVPLLIDYQ